MILLVLNMGSNVVISNGKVSPSAELGEQGIKALGVGLSFFGGHARFLPKQIDALEAILREVEAQA
jgi:hypothetical protein